MVNAQDFTKRLNVILNYYELSASGFADRVSVGRSTISHLISGRNKPSLDFVMKILEQFPEVDLYWLLNGVGSFPSTPSNEPKKVESKVGSLFDESQTTKKETPLSTTDSNSQKQQLPPVAENRVFESSKTISRIIVNYTDGTFEILRPSE